MPVNHFLKSPGVSVCGVTISCFDHSGSMSYSDYFPSRLGGAKDAQIAFFEKRKQINPNDIVAGVAFNHREHVFLEPVQIHKSSQIRQAVQKLQASGGTASAGLESAGYYADYYRKFNCPVNIIILTDGDISMKKKHFDIAESLKNKGTVIDTIGIAGRRKDVNETLLKRIATTDPDGYIHYRFIDDSEQLIRHYENLAAGLRIDPEN
jgi:uncharacterized protein with von Willebrand factor type A (vWA) domain